MSRPDEKKRSKVRLYLVRPNAWKESDREVAKATGVSVPLVGSVRMNLIFWGDIPEPPAGTNSGQFARKVGAVCRGGYRLLPNGRCCRETEYPKELRRLYRLRREGLREEPEPE